MDRRLQKSAVGYNADIGTTAEVIANVAGGLTALGYGGIADIIRNIAVTLGIPLAVAGIGHKIEKMNGKK